MNQFLIEKKLIDCIQMECLKIPFSNEKISVILTLDNNEFLDTLNKEQLFKVIKTAGFDVEIKKLL